MLNEYKTQKVMRTFSGIAIFLLGSILISILALVAVLIWAGIWTVLEVF